MSLWCWRVSVELCEIETLVAQLRADVLNGEIKGAIVATLFELTRLTNTASRLRESLGLNAEPPDGDEAWWRR